MPKDPELDESLFVELNDRWMRFVETLEPLRPELFRFCRRLTGNAFDAEDLVHDGFLRAFGALATQPEIANPRAWLLRIVTNLWIDEKRRARPEPREELDAMRDVGSERDPAAPDRTAALRDAAERALAALPPRERAAVVLKEAFDLSHAEIADLLSTTVGAVKTALHRGRRRLERDGDPVRAPRVSRELVDRFVETFLTYDLDAVKALLVENVEAEVFPYGPHTGRERAAKEGWLNGCFYHHVRWREEAKEPFPLRLEVREVEGEPVVLVFRAGRVAGDGEALEEVWRLEEEDGLVARVRDYGFCPDLVRWIAERLRLPFRAVGYRLRENTYESE